MTKMLTTISDPQIAQLSAYFGSKKSIDRDSSTHRTDELAHEVAFCDSWRTLFLLSTNHGVQNCKQTDFVMLSRSVMGQNFSRQNWVNM